MWSRVTLRPMSKKSEEQQISAYNLGEGPYTVVSTHNK